MSIENLTDEQYTVLNDAIDEAVIAHQKIEMQKEQLKSIAEVVKDELDVKPADFNALAKERYDESVSDKLFKIERIVNLNEQLETKRRRSN